MQLSEVKIERILKVFVVVGLSVNAVGQKRQNLVHFTFNFLLETSFEIGEKDFALKKSFKLRFLGLEKVRPS